MDRRRMERGTNTGQMKQGWMGLWRMDGAQVEYRWMRDGGQDRWVGRWMAAE